MGHWGFVIMAYGIVWSSIAVYVTILKRRLAKAQRNLDAVRARPGVEEHEKE
jgi:CcmD family protein